MNSDTVPPPGASPFKANKKADKPLPLYPFEPLAYLNQFLARYDGLDIADLLELAASVDDAGKVWASGNDLLRRDYLEKVEQAIRDHRTGQRPEIVVRQNTWGGDYLSRQPVISWGLTRCALDLDIKDPDEARRLTGLALSMGYTYGIEKVDDFHLFPGNTDQAKAHITAFTQAKKDPMAKTTPWTKDHDEKLEALAAEFKVLPSQVNTMATDILHMSIRDANKELHPDRILAQIRAGLPNWAKAWITEPPDSKPVEDDELTAALFDGAKRLQEIKARSAVSQSEKADPVGDTPVTPVNPPVIEKKAAPEPVLEATVINEKIDVSDAGDEDGKAYTWEASWMPDMWNVAIHSIYKFTEGQHEEIKKIITGYLKPIKDHNCLFSWLLDTPPVALINALRSSLDAIIRDGWKELDNEDSKSQRVDKLQEILKVDTTVDALQTYGSDGAIRLVSAARQAKLSADVVEMTKRQEAERQAQDKQPSALVTTNQAVAHAPAALTLLPPMSPIMVPTPAEQMLMDKVARFAVTCSIYPNEAAAWLALYTGFCMGFGIPASTRFIYAFIGKGGKVNIYVSSDGYAAKCLSRRDICEKFVVVNDTPESAIAYVIRRGEPERTFTYSKAEAEAAGLWSGTDKPAWKQNPKAMLRHRVAREAALGAFPEICADLGITKAEDEDEEFQPVELAKAASF